MVNRVFIIGKGMQALCVPVHFMDCTCSDFYTTIPGDYDSSKQATGGTNEEEYIDHGELEVK